MNMVMNGDKVKVRVWMWFGCRRLEGEVEMVLERVLEFFIGIICFFLKYVIVIIDGIGNFFDIFVGLEYMKNVSDGEKVIVKIINWDCGLCFDFEG